MGGWSGPAKDVSDHWMPAFAEPLGEPHGLATKSADGVYTRKFGPNVTVTFDTHTNKGVIAGWGSFPPPAPPAPPAKPTAQCPHVKPDCAYKDGDVGTSKGPTWADCCAQCATNPECVAWTWRTQNAPNYCHLHGPTAQFGPDAGAVCGDKGNSK